jgi:hypothetical protein
LDWVCLPFGRGLARFDLRIVIARIALARRGHDHRVDNLAPHGKVTLLLETGVKPVEQPFNRPGCGQGFAIQPQRLGVGNGVLQPGATNRMNDSRSRS